MKGKSQHHPGLQKTSVQLGEENRNMRKQSTKLSEEKKKELYSKLKKHTGMQIKK